MIRRIGLVSGLVVLLCCFAYNPAYASVNDFSFDSFTATYYLSRDSENRSTAKVTETLIAQFPNFNQNHGIERALPDAYDNHSVSLKITDITQVDGTPWNYTIYSSNNNSVVRIGDPNVYVQGKQSYVITYAMRDVTKNWPEGDEFYWDVNGTDWSQPFSEVRVSIQLDNELTAALNNRVACYTGGQGSNQSDCSITIDNGVINAQANRVLEANETLTVVVGFKPNTFAAYVAEPIPWWIWIVVLVIVPLFYIALPIWICVWALRKWLTQGRDTYKKTTIVPQYVPPKNTSVLISDTVLNTQMHPKAVSATIIDLAVRHYLKIYELDNKEYEFELNRLPNNLYKEEQAVVNMFFGPNSSLGQRVSLKDRKNVYTIVNELGTTVYGISIEKGLMIDTRATQKSLNRVAIGVLVLSIFTINILLLFAAIAAFIISYYMPARTKSGVELKMYLEGVKMYMQVAEAERLQMLQSPTTATKIDVDDTRQLVKLYGRLLPITMLFGIEKEWAKQFAGLYTKENQPDWFVGNYSTMNAGVFAGALTQFEASTTTSFSPPSSSTSSGFSSGGGFSGGGGGGGGGGGW